MACVSINGANRLGSNSLPELLVFGARAGRAAAEYASRPQPSPRRPSIAQAKDERAPAGERLPRNSGAAGSAWPTSATRCRRPWRRAPASTAPASRCARRSSTLREPPGAQSRDIALEDHSRTFNTERVAALELSFMLDVAETIVHSALQREESRGAHQRTDFPARDDERFLAHSLASRRRTARAGSSTCRSRSPAGRPASGSTGGSD